MAEVKIRLAAGTNIGLIRHNNEDSFAISSDLSTSEWTIPQNSSSRSLTELGALLAVADGMGGTNAGEVASSIAIKTIQECFVPDQISKAIEDDYAILNFMRAAVNQANLNILGHSQQHPETTGMGTTIVIAWILGQKVYVCWCGDSRCYVLNSHNNLIQLSKDHSYVQELVDIGELSQEQMHKHPLSNIITRCLGSSHHANPETNIYQIEGEDVIMLCSDGLCGLCDDKQILTTMLAHKNAPLTCKDELISAALSEGGYDNITIALADIAAD